MSCPSIDRQLSPNTQLVLNIPTVQALSENTNRTVLLDMTLGSWALQSQTFVPKLDISPCLNTSCNTLYVLNRRRYASWRECLRIQGFPDDFHCAEHLMASTKGHVYIGAGNSMCVQLIIMLLRINMTYRSSGKANKRIRMDPVCMHRPQYTDIRTFFNPRHMESIQV